MDEELLIRGEKVGVLKVRLFRPFSARQTFVAGITGNRSRAIIAVLDRTKKSTARRPSRFIWRDDRTGGSL